MIDEGLRWDDFMIDEGLMMDQALTIYRNWIVRNWRQTMDHLMNQL